MQHIFCGVSSILDQEESFFYYIAFHTDNMRSTYDGCFEFYYAILGQSGQQHVSLPKPQRELQ